VRVTSQADKTAAAREAAIDLEQQHDDGDEQQHEADIGSGGGSSARSESPLALPPLGLIGAPADVAVSAATASSHAAAAAATPSARTIFVSAYKKSVVASGDTKPIKGTLKELGGRWNRSLMGWVFPAAQREVLVGQLAARHGGDDVPGELAQCISDPLHDTTGHTHTQAHNQAHTDTGTGTHRQRHIAHRDILTQAHGANASHSLHGAH
jgi:hypothetical protein